MAVKQIACNLMDRSDHSLTFSVSIGQCFPNLKKCVKLWMSVLDMLFFFYSKVVHIACSGLLSSLSTHGSFHFWKHSPPSSEGCWRTCSLGLPLSLLSYSCSMDSVLRLPGAVLSPITPRLTSASD